MERELESLFKGVAHDLLDVHVRTEQRDQPGLVFPVYRGGDFRVSEQEAKQLFLFRLHSGHRWRFSVETPTCEAHGTGRQSARVDASLFACNDQSGVHVEFKEGNGDWNGIRTSLEKLVREEKLAGWFHTLAQADQGTALSLKGKFIRSLESIRHYLEDCRPHKCLVAFCVIRQRLLLFHWLTLGAENSFENCEHAFGDLTLDASRPSPWSVPDWNRRTCEDPGECP
jgi:hypothetical protein